MSGGIAQLISIGAQDAHLVGNPEVSFFKSSYRRHTNFAQSVEKQVIQGRVQDNGMSTVRFERKGDLLSYIYLAPSDGVNHININDWSQEIAKVELLIGGQVVDTQDAPFTEIIAPDVLASTTTKAYGKLFSRGVSGAFYPLRFFNCESYHAAIPLVALQYHDVEIRITWGPNAGTSGYKWECMANYIYLDTDERNAFSSRPMDILCFQVQHILASGTKIQELTFNHPIKYLVSANPAGVNILADGNKVKLQLNGVDATDFKFAHPHYSTVPSFYHVQNKETAEKNLFLYTFCLDTTKTQPTGSLNFSRLDSARLVSTNDTFNDDMYAVNYNVLHIEKGMGGLMYAN